MRGKRFHQSKAMGKGTLLRRSLRRRKRRWLTPIYQALLDSTPSESEGYYEDRGSKL